MVGDSCDFEYAWALVESQDFPKVWEYVVPYANAGDADAQCMMGFLCQFSPPRDLTEAERWLRKAAEQNNPVAWNTLGTLLLNKGETENAEECYRRAAELAFTISAPLPG